MRKSLIAGLVVTAVALLVLAGCGGSGEPTEFNATVEENFVKGCEIEVSANSDLANNAMDICSCAYERITGNNGITFAQFKGLDDDLREDINALSQEGGGDTTINTVRGYIRDCIERNETG